MLVKMAVALPDAADGWLNNAVKESLYLHARQLITFFLGRLEDTRPNDIVRTDFTDGADDWLSPTDVDIAARLIGTDMPVFHRYLAHLTWDRAAFAQHDDAQAEAPWDGTTVAADIVRIADAWTWYVYRRRDDDVWRQLRPWVVSACTELGLTPSAPASASRASATTPPSESGDPTGTAPRP